MTVRAIHAKVLRDISRAKAPFVATVVIVFLGVALFGAAYASYENLTRSYDYSYDTLDFADVVVGVAGVPANVTGAVEALGLVRTAYARIQVDVAAEITARDVRVVGRAVTIPRGVHPPVNDLVVTEGTYPSQGAQALAEVHFAEHHGLHAGDRVRFRLPDGDLNVTLSGVANSPEYIWPARNKLEIWPDPEHFGVFFLPFDLLDGRVLPSGIANQVCILLDTGLSATDRDAATAAAVSLLTPYRVQDVVKREDQASYALLKIDIEGFRELAFLFPALFLTVAAIVLYMSLTRTVAVQRPQVGVLRAMGYRRRDVTLHYLEYAALAVLLGALLGSLAGHFLAGFMTNLYVGILGLPFLLTEPVWEAVPAGVGFSLIAGMLGAALPALAAARIRPAESMRSYGSAPVGTGRVRSRPRGGKVLRRLPLRNVARNKRRSVFTVISLAFAVALILTSVGFVDSVDEIVAYQYETIEAFDAKVELAGPAPESLVGTVSATENVTTAEPMLELPVNISFAGKTHTTFAAGIEPAADLYRLYDGSGNRLRVDSAGVVLTAPMAKSLGAGPGDRVTVETPYNSTVVEVRSVARQPFGPEAFLPLAVAQDFAGLPGLITSVLVTVRSGSMDSVERALEGLPGVAGVQVKADVRASFEELMSLFTEFTVIMVSFGVAMGVALVLNAAILNASERRREHATMRALGVRVGELARVLTAEILVLGLLSLALGAVLGTFLASWFGESFTSELFAFEIAIYPRSYAVTTVGILALALLSQVPPLRTVARMNLADEVRARLT